MVKHVVMPTLSKEARTVKYVHDVPRSFLVIMLRGLNCKKGHLVLDDIKWIDKDTSDLLPRSKLYYGDILMTYAGTIGDVAMVDADDKTHTKIRYP